MCKNEFLNDRHRHTIHLNDKENIPQTPSKMTKINKLYYSNENNLHQLNLLYTMWGNEIVAKKIFSQNLHFLKLLRTLNHDCSRTVAGVRVKVTDAI